MTKVFNKRNAKRITAILLAVIAVVSSILIIPANAAGKEVTITFDYCYDTGDNIITFVKYTEHGGYTVGTVGEELCRIYADGKDAYCLEPGHSLYSGNTLTTALFRQHPDNRCFGCVERTQQGSEESY